MPIKHNVEYSAVLTCNSCGSKSAASLEEGKIVKKLGNCNGYNIFRICIGRVSDGAGHQKFDETVEAVLCPYCTAKNLQKILSELSYEDARKFFNSFEHNGD